MNPLMDQTATHGGSGACAVLLGAALASSAFVADRMLYGVFVVPRLSEWDKVPLFWWLLVGSPVVLAGIAVGALSGSVGACLRSAVWGAVLVSGYLFWAAHAHQPGHGKSLAVQAPAEFWLTSVAGITTGFFVLSSGALLARRAIERSRRG